MADEKDCEGASSLENSRSRVGGVDSRYLATLQPQDRKRFQEKLKYEKFTITTQLHSSNV